MPRRIALSVGGREFLARPLADLTTLAALAFGLHPVRCVQDQWSGGLLRSLETGLGSAASAASAALADRYTYQYAGLVGLEPVDGRITLAYGDAKSQIAESLRPVVPLAVVEHDVDVLVKTCHAVQFNGAIEVTLRATAAPREPDGPVAADFAVTLGDVRASAAFVAEADAELVEAFVASLPLTGTATNTHSGGPLTRFWNDLGGEEGETPLPLSETAVRSQVLRPGHMYYLPSAPWRGFRLALREPTIMRSAVAGGANQLAPVAAFADHLDELAQIAAGLPVLGRAGLKFERV